MVFLFGRLAPQLGFTVESVHPWFPDCRAVRHGHSMRIEFEFRASNFATQRHSPKKADIVVCWENDWAVRPKAYQRLEIISLKEWVGAQRRVFAAGCDENISGHELTARRLYWNVPAFAEIGDLVLIYRKKPTGAIRDVWELVGPPEYFKKGNRYGFYPGYQAPIRNLVRLKRPVTYEQLSKHPLTRKLPVVRKRFQGKSEVTDDWPALHSVIVDLNPRAKAALRDYIAE